jgi:hypothetical protein
MFLFVKRETRGFPKRRDGSFRQNKCDGGVFYTRQFKEIFNAHKKGYTSQKKSPVVIIPEP